MEHTKLTYSKANVYERIAWLLEYIMLYMQIPYAIVLNYLMKHILYWSEIVAGKQHPVQSLALLKNICIQIHLCIYQCIYTYFDFYVLKYNI